MHHDRRREYVDQVIQAQDVVRESKYLGDTLHDAAIAWGRLTFFIAIGLLLFLWPRIAAADSATLTGYALTVLYLMSPLGADHRLAAVPGMGHGLGGADRATWAWRLDEQAEQPEQNAALDAVADWQEIELAGVNPCLSSGRAAQRLRARPDRRDDPPRPDRLHHRRQRQRQDHLGQADHRALPARKRPGVPGRPADHAPPTARATGSCSPWSSTTP